MSYPQQGKDARMVVAVVVVAVAAVAGLAVLGFVKPGFFLSHDTSGGNAGGRSGGGGSAGGSASSSSSSSSSSAPTTAGGDTKEADQLVYRFAAAVNAADWTSAKPLECGDFSGADEEQLHQVAVGEPGLVVSEPVVATEYDYKVPFTVEYEGAQVTGTITANFEQTKWCISGFALD